MTAYLLHATLTTGHMARHSRKDSDSRAIEAVTGLLDVVLLGGRVEIPGHPGHYATGVNVGRNLIVTLAAGDDPILTTAVCIKSRSSPRLWQMMHDDRYSLTTVANNPPAAPWIADRIEPGALDHMESMRWTGGWARALGWAWVEYDQ